MRQKSHTSRRANANRFSGNASSGKQMGYSRGGITITPLRGFFITLLFLGVPTVSLGTLCLSLVQNNLRLSEKNDELQAIATEVKAEVDSLGDEIDFLKERAGVPTTEEASVEKADLEASTESESSNSAQSNTVGESDQNAYLKIEADGAQANRLIRSGILANALEPKGGLANTVDPIVLLRDVKQQVPKLNRDLDNSIKPALEETLAEEAAYPDGQPVVGIVEVSSEFGIRGNPFGGSGYEMHDGMDFVGAYGDIIAATGNGVVTLAGPNGGYGNTVTINHNYGYETLYAHMSEVKVSVGETVKRGQIIGYIGSTGRSSGPHLHYSLYKNDQAIDPRTLLKLPENNLAQGPR